MGVPRSEQYFLDNINRVAAAMEAEDEAACLAYNLNQGLLHLARAVERLENEMRGLKQTVAKLKR